MCKKFFLSTLDIGKKCVSFAMQQKQQGVFIGEDKRGRNAPGNKTPEACIEYICKRIEFFPTF